MSFARTYSARYQGKSHESEILNLPLLERKKNNTTEQLLDETFNLQQVEEELKTLKEENNSKKKSIEKRRERLLEKECKLKESFVKFERYLRENNTKKERAEKKIHEEKSQARHKNTEYIKLLCEFDKLKNYKESVNELISKRLVFKKFMEKFKDESGIFTSIDASIDHHKSLIKEHENLIKTNRENQLILADLKNKLTKITESHKENMLVFNNQISQLSREFDAEHSRRIQLEANWNHICDTSTTKTLDIGKIKMVIHTIFMLLKNTRAIHFKGIEDFSVQLKTIGEYSEHMSKFINEEIREQLATAFIKKMKLEKTVYL